MTLNSTEIEVFRESQIAELAELEPNSTNLIQTGLRIVLAIAKNIQLARENQTIATYIKQDGSITTNIDIDSENIAREIINKTFPSHQFFGEESNYANTLVLPQNTYSWAIDPIDGTNGFVSHENTSAISLSLFKDNQVLLSIVCNPFTGEIYYSYKDNNSRLIRQYGLGGNVFAHELPLGPTTSSDNLFINVHPRPENDTYLQRMIRARTEGKVQKVIQPGGSPAYWIASVAKGGFSYINDFAGTNIAPWDIAGAARIIQNTPNAQITDLAGNEIDLLAQQIGVAVVSSTAKIHTRVLRLLNE